MSKKKRKRASVQPTLHHLSETSVKLADSVTSTETKSHMSMGLPTDFISYIFCRQFRFTLEGFGLPKHFIKKAHLDLVKKELSFDVYQICGESGLPADKWLRNTTWADGELTLTTYDGCGEPLYEVIMSQLILKEHTVDFDYSTSAECCDHLRVGFSKFQKTYLYKPVKSKKNWPGKSEWWLAIKDDNGTVLERQISLDQRPNIDIEEVEMNFLNSKTWVPGKASWDDFTIRMTKDDDIETLLHKNEGFDILLRNEKGEVAERWSLKKPLIAHRQEFKEHATYTFKLTEVSYENH
jgi:hypothetical protein